ncbi:MAG: hypothetical protein ACTIC1_05720 [Brevibacterium sp.]|uniref:hypothetical protein n=1 Tax=Brevibacterium aurantiacum TaxID=273384 RepID=UPI003F938529
MKAKILGLLAGLLIFVAGVAGSVWLQGFDHAIFTMVGFVVAFVGGFFSTFGGYAVHEYIEDKEFRIGR